MGTYTINPDRTVTTDANKTTSFKERLDAQYPTPNSDKLDTTVINDYDEHKLYKWFISSTFSYYLSYICNNVYGRSYTRRLRWIYYHLNKEKK